jgi:hypothetical protein
MAEKTAYADRLARATLDFGDGSAHVLERIYVHDAAEEEIRWCYYKNGRFVVRPPDLPERDLLRLSRLRSQRACSRASSGSS